MNRTRLFAFVLIVASAACGGSNPPAVDASSIGTRAVATAPPANQGPPPGVLSALDVKNLTVMSNVGAALVGDDPVLREFGGMLYIVNSADGDNVTLVDAVTLQLVDQVATGASSNPQDVAVVGNKLYVPSLGTAGVVVATRGSATTTTIDLSTAVGDPDGKPDCVSAYLVGTDLYVACDQLDAMLNPRGPGKIVIVDTTTDTVKTTLTLPVANPQNQLVPLGTDLVIATAPSFTDYSTGCLVRVSTSGTPSTSCLLQNSVVNGFQAHTTASADGKTLWMAVSNFAPVTFDQTGTLMSYTVASSQVSAALSPAGEFVTDVASCPDGSVVYADRTGAGGLRVFKGAAELTTAELSVGLPPGFGNDLVCY